MLLYYDVPQDIKNHYYGLLCENLQYYHGCIIRNNTQDDTKRVIREYMHDKNIVVPPSAAAQ